MSMPAHRKPGPRGGSNKRNSDTGPRRRSGRTRRGHPVLTRFWMSIIGASVTILAVGAVIKAAPLITVATSATTTTTVTQVGTATTFESYRAAATVTRVPAGTATGDVLLTLVETHPGARVTCTSGAKLILDHSSGTGTQLSACMPVPSRFIPSAIRVRISPSNEVAAVTMAFAGVDQSAPVDAKVVSSSTSPSMTVPANDV